MIDRLAQKASENLQAATSADLEAGLREVYAAHSRHRRVTRLAAAAAVLAALGTGWWGGHALTASRSVGPTTPVSPSPTQSPVCSAPRVTCLSHRTYTFALDTPVRWHIPRGYSVNSGYGATPVLVETYANVGESGVTVMEGVRASDRAADATVPGVPPTASGFVHWIAARPYLEASSPQRTTLDDRPAWQVRVTLRPDVGAGLGACNPSSPTGATPCHPITLQDGRRITGIWSDMVADYTASDVPGAGTVVVWSWAFGHHTEALARNRDVVRGVSWRG